MGFSIIIIEFDRSPCGRESLFTGLDWIVYPPEVDHPANRKCQAVQRRGAVRVKFEGYFEQTPRLGNVVFATMRKVPIAA